MIEVHSRKGMLAAVLVTLAALLLACTLPTLGTTLPAKDTPKAVATPSTTDEQGRAVLEDPRGAGLIAIDTQDAATQRPVSGVEVYTLQEGPDYLLLAQDPQGRYLARWQEASLQDPGADGNPSPPSSWFVAGEAHAQTIPAVLLLLKLTSDINSLQDLAAYLQNPPVLKHWGILYEERCWTGEQLAAYVGAAGLVIPGIGEVGGALAKGLDEVIVAVFAISQHVLEQDARQRLLDLDRPVRIRTYHLGIPILGMVPVGWCEEEEAIPTPSPVAHVPEATSPAVATSPTVAKRPTELPAVPTPGASYADLGFAYDLPGWLVFEGISYARPHSGAVFRGGDPLRLGTDPVWSPDGEWIAFSSSPLKMMPEASHDLASKPSPSTTQVYIARRDGTDFIQVTRSHSDAEHPAWSPDGQWLAYHSLGTTGRSIFIVNLNGGEPVQLTRESDDQYPAWSPDSEWIAFQRNYERLCLVRVDGSDTRCPELQTAEGTKPIWVGSHLDWSPDGEWLATSDGESIARVNPANGEVFVLLQAHGGSHPTWSPDGEWIAFYAKDGWDSNKRGGTWIVHKDGGPALPAIRGASKPDWSSFTDFSAPSYPVAPGWIGYDSEWGFCVMRSDGSRHQCLTQGRPGDEWPGPYLSPDGRWLASVVDGTISIVPVDGSAAVEEVLSSPVWNASEPLYWSADGRWISFFLPSWEVVTVARDGSGAHVFDPGARAESRWSADGEWRAFECLLESEPPSIYAPSTDICIEHKDGSETKRLTQVPEGVSAWSRSPVWSPDGAWIAFLFWGVVRAEDSLVGERLCFVRTDGTERTCLFPPLDGVWPLFWTD